MIFEETSVYFKFDNCKLFFPTDSLRIPDDDIIHTVIDFLSYLKLKGINSV